MFRIVVHLSYNFVSNVIGATNVLSKNENNCLMSDFLFQVSWCNNYLQHTVQMFYEVLDFTNESSNSGSPCRQFRMNVVPGTSLFLLGIPSRSIHQCSESSLMPQEVSDTYTQLTK